MVYTSIVIKMVSYSFQIFYGTNRDRLKEPQDKTSKFLMKEIMHEASDDRASLLEYLAFMYYLPNTMVGNNGNFKHWLHWINYR